jgi:hypothetical protein
VDEAWLRQKYLTEGLSAAAIGKLVQRDPKRVYEWLTAYNIPMRKRPGRDDVRQYLAGHTSTKPDAPYIEYEWLYRAYVIYQRSAHDIAQGFGVTEANIVYFLGKLNIPRRSITEARKIKHWSSAGEANGMFGKRGEEVPSWKGGITPLRQQIQHSLPWKNAVTVVWERDKGCCQRCGLHDEGQKKKPFHVHHLVHYTYLPLTTDPSNLVLLCHKCHRWVHTKHLNIHGDFLLPVPSE